MSNTINNMPQFPKIWTPVQPVMPVMQIKPKYRTLTEVAVKGTSSRNVTVPKYSHIMTQLYKLDAIVIPTNYKCVMGRGLARQMNRVFPGLGKMFLQVTGKDATAVKGVMASKPQAMNRAYLKPLHGKRHGLTARQRLHPSFAKPKVALVYFPVKDDWMNNASIDIIRESAGKLKTWLEARPQYKRVAIPKVGCGNGRLKWETVRPELIPLLNMDQIQLYDYPTSTPTMHRDLLYDWLGSAQPHFRGNAEYAGIHAERLKNLRLAILAKQAGMRTIHAQDSLRNCTKYSFVHKNCVYAQEWAYFTDAMCIDCATCNYAKRRLDYVKELQRPVDEAQKELDRYNLVWSKVEINRIMEAHPKYGANSLKHCSKYVLNLHGNAPSRAQKAYARQYIRAKEVRIIYCSEIYNYRTPEIVDIIKGYLSYGSKVTVYDYRTPDCTVYEGRDFLEQVYPDDSLDKNNLLLDYSERRRQVEKFIKDYDYVGKLTPYVHRDTNDFVERHVHIVDFNKNEFDAIKNASLIPDLMTEDELDEYILHQFYLEKVVNRSKSAKIHIKLSRTTATWHPVYVLASKIKTRQVFEVGCGYMPVARFRLEQVERKFTLGRELDLPLFESDINPDWCYGNGTNKAVIGSNDAYDGESYLDSIE